VSLRSEGAVYDAIFAVFPDLVPGLAGHADPVPDLSSETVTRTELADLFTSDRFGPWTEALQRVGNCARPIRLRGTSSRIDSTTGEILSSYSSADEPIGITYTRCGNRREAVCPSCSRLYAGDTFHLIRAGVSGGKTVPEHVADNPLVFATLTAPSFGRVHGRRDGLQRCHPERTGRCRHGCPAGCPARHAEDDPQLGQPLCADCYDYDSHVVWQWWAPHLWRRFTIALRRSVAKDLGIPATRLAEAATVQYAKVAEDQRRGAIHFHALIRLDGPASPEGFAPAAAGIDAARLAVHVRRAAAHVRLTVAGVDEDDSARILAFGRQVDARPVSTRRRPDDPTRILSAEQVAGYLAKYATKSAGQEADATDGHHRRMRATCRALAARARISGAAAEGGDYEGLGRWVHNYGFRGHFASKSRHYSITLGALRRARRRAQALLAEARQLGERIDLAALEAELLADEAETTLVIGHWQYVGTGWANRTERVLALAAAARAREYDVWKAEQRRNNSDNSREGRS